LPEGGLVKPGDGESRDVATPHVVDDGWRQLGPKELDILTADREGLACRIVSDHDRWP
jgi:hypothetical protein